MIIGRLKIFFKTAFHTYNGDKPYNACPCVTGGMKLSARTLGVHHSARKSVVQNLASTVESAASEVVHGD